MTNDNPIASNLRPANSGLWALADGGRLFPVTWEKLTPPCSMTAPSLRTRLIPPPPSLSPSSRCHSLRSNTALPSTSSSALQILSWSLIKYALTASLSG